MIEFIKVKDRNFKRLKGLGGMSPTLLANNESWKKNDNTIIRWKAKQIIKDTMTILLSERYSGAVVLFIT